MSDRESVSHGAEDAHAGESVGKDASPAKKPVSREWADGVVYDGAWKRGKPNGFGTAEFPDGTRYEGWWVDGKRHTEDGQTSRCWFPNGNVYEGAFYADDIHGDGCLKDGQGETLDPGPWEHNVSQYTPYPINGVGDYTMPDGSTYSGHWEDGLFHGQGRFSWTATGDVYEGEFRRGEMHGVGKYSFRNGDVYEGSFSRGKPTGDGEYKWTKENQAYKGEWADGMQHGEGEHFFDASNPEEGLQFKGAFAQGRMHGWGELTVEDFAVRSMWNDGRNDQVDMNCFPDLGSRDVHTFHFKGGTYTGTWNPEKRVPNGTGKMVYSDGSVFEGGFKDFRFHGDGKLVHSTGVVYEGEWRAGAPHGRGAMRRVAPAASGGGER